MTPIQRALLHARLDAMEEKAQRIGWQINARDCEFTLGRIDRAMAAGYGFNGPDVPGGLLSRAAVRSELLRLTGVIARTMFEIRLAQLRAKANFNPAQPRVPKNNPGGGRWTRDGGAPKRAAPKPSDDLSAIRRRPPAGVPAHTRFRELNPTLDQRLRYGEATDRADEALAQVRKLDPNWRPSFDAYENNAEGLIRRTNDDALKAEKRLLELLRDVPAQGASQATGGAESTEDILAPRGRAVGLRARGASENIRTVTPREFYDIFDRLKGRRVAGGRASRLSRFALSTPG